jgi:hypothetical protein
MHISALDGHGDLHSVSITSTFDYTKSFFHYQYHQQSFLLQKHYPFQKIQGQEVRTLLL